MRLLHTSDWHLGMPAGPGSCQEDQRFFLSQLYEIIRRERVEAVLCAGDVYDSGSAGAEAIALYTEAATTICARLGVPFVVVAGNHDSAPRLAACRELLRPSGLFVTGRLTRDVEPVLLDSRTAVYPVPFFGRDEAAALFPEAEIRSMEDACRAVCGHIRETMDRAKRNILLTHAFVVSAQLSESDRSARVGFAQAVSREVFDGFDYVALGHLHRPQSISPAVRYSGSPVAYSFGEEGQQKGVVLLDTETLEQTFLPLTPLRRRRTVRDTCEAILAREDLQNDYLRLYVTDRYAGLELFSELQSRFPYLLEVYGKSLSQQEDASALTVEELEKLDDMDIMKKFMAELFDYEPTKAQLHLFREALALGGEEESP